MILLHTFTKTGINLATRLELLQKPPPRDANSRLLCNEFHARMKRISRANDMLRELSQASQVLSFNLILYTTSQTFNNSNIVYVNIYIYIYIYIYITL